MNVLSITSVTIFLAIFSGVFCQNDASSEVSNNDLLNPIKLIIDTVNNTQHLVYDVARDVQQILNEVSILKLQQHDRCSNHNSKEKGGESEENSGEKKEHHSKEKSKEKGGESEENSAERKEHHSKEYGGKSHENSAEKKYHHSNEKSKEKGGKSDENSAEEKYHYSAPAKSQKYPRAVADVDEKDSISHPRNLHKRFAVNVLTPKGLRPIIPNIMKRSVVDVDVKDSEPHPQNLHKRFAVNVLTPKGLRPILPNIMKRSVVNVDLQGSTPHVSVDPNSQQGSKVVITE